MKLFHKHNWVLKKATPKKRWNAGLMAYTKLNPYTVLEYICPDCHGVKSKEVEGVWSIEDFKKL